MKLVNKTFDMVSNLGQIFCYSLNLTSSFFTENTCNRSVLIWWISCFFGFRFRWNDTAKYSFNISDSWCSSSWFFGSRYSLRYIVSNKISNIFLHFSNKFVKCRIVIFKQSYVFFVFSIFQYTNFLIDMIWNFFFTFSFGFTNLRSFD